MRIGNENSIVTALIAELNKANDLIATVPKHLYSAASHAKGSIGAHVRHNLDFVIELVRGVQIGSVNYADRERDPRIEIDQRYAAWKVSTVIDSVLAISHIDPGTILAVRSEVCRDVRHRSSFSREVEFVHSHMVHHHALINERLQDCGLKMPVGLGISPSTQAHWDSIKLAA